jgi:hypothetical protein
MSSYVQKQVDMVSDALLKNKLPDFLRFYPVKIAQNWFDVSNGIINIDIANYCRKGIKISEKRFKTIDDRINELYKECDLLIFELNNLNVSKFTPSVIKSKLNEIREEIAVQKDIRNEEWNLQRRMRAYLDSKK